MIEKDRKSCFSIKNDFDLQTASGASVCWSKYTTNKTEIVFNLNLRFSLYSSMDVNKTFLSGFWKMNSPQLVFPFGKLEQQK